MKPYRPFVVAVPERTQMRPQSGMGRVFGSLIDRWGDQVRVVDAVVRAPRLPLLRNFPSGIKAPPDADLILLPKLIGAIGLRDTNRIPSLATVYDVGVLDVPADRTGMNWLTYFTIRQSLYALRHASHVVTGSRFTRGRLLHHLPALKTPISIASYGVSPCFLTFPAEKDESRSRLEHMVGITLGRPVLLNVGTELPRKNLGLLLTVFRAIKARYPDAQLLKVGGAGGKGWRPKTLQIADNLGLKAGTDMLFLEDIDDRILAHAYGAADVFVSTSLYEGFGLPALEAMAVGTPIVVSKRGAFPEVVGDVGWVVEPEIDPFVDAIEELISDGRSPERVERSRQRAGTFTWERATEEYPRVMSGAPH